MTNEIKEFQGEYRWLSNFWICTLEWDNKLWHSAENAYQAAKCARPYDMHQFINVTPGQAKRLGKTVFRRLDWEEVKLEIMCQIVKSKFEQNPDLRKRLLDTGNARLIEGNRWHDTFWGVCNGEGENNLGKILMSVRELLRK